MNWGSQGIRVPENEMGDTHSIFKGYIRTFVYIRD